MDDEIREIEQRLAARRHRIADTARLARHVAVRKVVSPTGLLAAAGIAFLTTVGLFRKKKAHAQVEGRAARMRRRRDDVKAGKLAGIASLLASAGFAIVRSQLGSPLEMAQFVASKVKHLQERKKKEGRVASERQGRMAPAG